MSDNSDQFTFSPFSDSDLSVFSDWMLSHRTPTWLARDICFAVSGRLSVSKSKSAKMAITHSKDLWRDFILEMSQVGK